MGQGKLYRVYDELLRARGVTSAQVLLTFFDMSARGHYLNARRTLRRLLDWRVVPVVNENDTTTTDEISFGDNDFLAAQLAILIGAERLVLLTDIDGLYTADPRTDPAAELVGEVTDFEGLSALDIAATTSPLGSGGMRSKVVAAEMATAAGHPGDDLQRPRRERAGGRARRRARWARASRPRAGALLVASSSGCATPSRRTGRSSSTPARRARCARAATRCCRSGSWTSTGAFDAGDAVEVADGGGVLIGKGICNYSADRAAPGPRHEERDVREVLPRATEEAVHRDYFVLA